MPDKTQTKPTSGSASPKVLVVDVGGTNVKMRMKGQKEATKIPSGPTMTSKKAVEIVKTNTKGWDYNCISLGYPGPIINGRPLREPHNLGGGWVGFNFAAACRVCGIKIEADAATIRPAEPQLAFGRGGRGGVSSYSHDAPRRPRVCRGGDSGHRGGCQGDTRRSF